MTKEQETTWVVGEVRHEGLRSDEAEWMGNEANCSVSEDAGKINQRAGGSRYIGRRPRVKGLAMNPVDHPRKDGKGKKLGKRKPVKEFKKKK